MDISDPPSEILLELQNILQSICSFSLQFDEKPNFITKEQSLVVKDIEKAIINDRGLGKTIIEGLTEMFSREAYIQKVLLPTTLKKEGVTFVIEQESLVRLLLRVSQLQDEVFKLLIDELVNVSSISEDCRQFRLLLNPLKYLPNINNPVTFSQSLLDLLEICNPELQLEMLDVIPDIIPDGCYETVAEQLLIILKSDDSPWEAIIECFGAFDFNNNIRENMYRKLMNLIVPVHPQCLPATIKLLFNNHKGKIPLEIFLRIRDIINCEMKKTDNISLNSDIVAALQSVSNKQHFIQSCLEMVNSIKNPKDHITFDLFVLLILGDDTKYKEYIKKKIESGFFTCELVKNMVLNDQYCEVLTRFHDNTNPLIKLTSFLLRFVSTKLEYFLISLFEAFLSHKTKEEKFRMFIKEIVECFIRSCNNSDMKCVHHSLRIFYTLVKKKPESFYDNLNKLTGLLKKMDDFDLHAASMVYKIICHFSQVLGSENPQSDVIDNEISMMIRKQLMSSKRLKKSKGIMGTIVLLQNDIISNIETEQDDDSDCVENSEIEDEGVSERTLTLIESVKVLTEGFPECAGMFYDELASIVNKNKIRKNFVDWMTKKTRFLLDGYISSSREQMSMINGLAFSPKYGVNTSERSLALRIGLMAVEPQKFENRPLILLPPLFHLYRMLIAKSVVDPIDSTDFKSFICSSFIMPSMDDIEDLSSIQLKNMLDVLYHSINYLKEVVDATITVPIHEDLFLDRFELLTKLENLFNNLLSKVSEHTFPKPYFNDCVVNKQIHETKKKGSTTTVKKRKISHNDTVASTSSMSMNELNTSTSPVLMSRKHTGLNSNSKYLIKHKIVFREMSLYSMFNMIQFSSKESPKDVQIGYGLLVFILRDLVTGLRPIVQKQTGKNDCQLSETPDEILKSILKDLPQVMVSFTELVKEMESLEIIDDSCETTCEIIMCFTHFLELFHIILSVPVEDQSELVNQVHRALDIGRNERDTFEETRKKVIHSFMNNLKISVALYHGVLIYQIVDKILQNVQSTNSTMRVTLCENILWKQWCQLKNLPFTEKQFNQDVKFILEKYLKEFKVEKLLDLLGKIASEYEDLKGKGDHLSSMPIINYTNFHILFVCLCTALHENVEREVQSRCSNMEHLKLWKNTTNFMFILIGIAKNVHCRQNVLLSTFLRKSIPILKIFISNALPIFDLMFSSKTEMVVDILKSMQASTRFIHHLCCQSKMFKNFSVISHIPGFRLVLEQLIYKVKALLVSNNCQEAFFLGNLKNKDIHGNTQTSEMIEEDIAQDSEQEEEIADDDSDVNMEDDRSESLTF